MEELKEEYVVYLLRDSSSGRTYIGTTNDLERRLRQHNGEIKGGAKYTTARGGDWRPMVVVRGFGMYGKTYALRFEWRAKRDANNKVISGLEARTKRMHELVESFNASEPDLPQPLTFYYDYSAAA